MIFVYIIFSAILLYFVLKYAIRDGIIESEANKEKLIYEQRNSNLFEEISSIYAQTSKNRDKAKKIYDQSLDVFTSGQDYEHIFEVLTENKKQILSLDYTD